MARILIINKDFETRNFLKYSIEFGGHEVFIARSKKEALETFRENPTEIVITDFNDDTKEELNTISELFLEYPKVRIISTYDRNHPDAPNFVHIAKKIGVHAFITKPIEEEMLSSTLEQVLAEAGKNPQDNMTLHQTNS